MADMVEASHEKCRPDMDALFADYVRDARIESGASSQRLSRQLFMEAAALAAEDAGLQLAFIECRPREHLVASIDGEAVADPGCLGRIAIKYATTADMFRAVMAAWHCGTAQRTTGATYTESDFLVWRPETNPSGDKRAQGGFGAPDYMFIDGFDAIADEDR